MPYIVTDKCSLCGACVVGCESNAIMEGDTQSLIDINLCAECGTCERNCPSEAIIFLDEAEYEAWRAKQGISPLVSNLTDQKQK